MKNRICKLVNLLLCVVVFGLFPTKVDASEAKQLPMYKASEDGTVYVGTVDITDMELETAADKIKLGKPKNLKWNKTVTWIWDDGGNDFEESLVTHYGSIAFGVVKPLSSEDCTYYLIRVFRNNKLFYEVVLVGFNDWKYLSLDLIPEVEFESGTYYFTVQALSMGEDTYANSAVATSPKWTYTKPSVQTSKPTGLKWNWPEAKWNNNYETLYMIEWFQSATKNDEPKLIRRDHGYYEGINRLYEYETVLPGYYYFRVRTVSSDIMNIYHSDWSKLCGPYYVDGVEFITAPKLKASNVAASGKVKLTWNDVEDATKYQVYRANSKNGTYKRITTTGKTSYVDTSAKVGSKYFYKIRAISPSGNTKSKYSNIVNRTCDLPRPDISVSLNASKKPRVTWDAIDGAIKYQVYRANKKDGTYQLLGTTSKTSFVNKNAVQGKTYFYKVKAIYGNTAANSAYSVVRSIKVK